MKCGVCGDEFATVDLIVLIRYFGERVFAHYHDCSLSRDGAITQGLRPCSTLGYTVDSQRVSPTGG